MEVLSLNKLKWAFMLAIVPSLVIFSETSEVSAQTTTSASQVSIAAVQIESTASGYQLNIHLNNAANVTSVNIGTQNPFGGMPHNVVPPTGVKKQSNGTWLASLGAEIPSTLTIYRRLWIMPTNSVGQGQNYRWEDGDFRLTYEISSGDTMYRIAKAFNLPLSREIRANPQLGDPNIIYPGEVVLIPNIKPIPPMVQVQNGDTMSKIAQSFGIPLNRVIDANPQISNPNVIQVGQTIHLPQQF
jgi:LysM repeat protein